jgi:hypothetical protein
MPICPVCEHNQVQGNACDQCGKVFTQQAIQTVSTPVLPELEQNAHVAAPAQVALERIPELESTAFRPAPAPPAERVSDLEPTALPSAAAVAPSAPVPDLDLGRVVSDGTKTAPPGDTITCRYCRTVQTGGVMCERCGMRLPRSAKVPQAAAPSKAEASWTRCRKCGGRAKSAELCPSCGDPVPATSA